MDKTSFIQRISPAYIKSDCMQTMCAYKSNLTVFTEDEVIFQHNVGEPIKINKYINDERKAGFPYSEIPLHMSRIPFHGKYNHANIILEYNKPYIKLRDDLIELMYAVKEGNEVLIFHKALSGKTKKRTVTREELEEFYGNNSNNINSKRIELHIKDSEYDDNLRVTDKKELTSEDDIQVYIMREVKKVCEEFKEYMTTYSSTDTVKNYLRRHPLFLQYANQSIKKEVVRDMEFLIELKNTTMITTKKVDGMLVIEYSRAAYISSDKYQITTTEIPVETYDFNQIKYASYAGNIVTTFALEPKFPANLNRGIDRKEIKSEKQIVRKLNKEKE